MGLANPNLNVVTLHIISSQDAENALGETVYDYEVACTGVGNVRQGACHADSGGPLVTWSSALNEYVLIGVVSWGRSDCAGNNSNSPSVFVRISSIANWITGHITASLSGPSLLCNGSSGTFTVSGVPSGYTWTCSSGLTAGSSSGNSKTFRGNNTGNGFLGWVAVNLGSAELARKEVWIGKPYGSPSEVAVGISYGVPKTITPPLDGSRQKMGITGFNRVWHRNTGNAALTDNGMSATVTVYTSGSHTLYAYGVNSCGGNSTGSPMFAYRISEGNTTYSMSAYPNPVSGTLNVQVEGDGEASVESSSSRINGSGQQRVYTIRLYSIAGTLALQTTASGSGTVQLHVGSLPAGIYKLQVYDGTENPPLTQTIVISH
jgi:hypothetical protein